MVFYQQVTISLLEKAMDESPHQRFLIDGFPRNEENRSSFESQVITLEGLPYARELQAQRWSGELREALIDGGPQMLGALDG